MVHANQESRSKLLLTVAFCLLTSMIGAQSASADTIFFDDFNDRDAEDGMPVTWAPGLGTWDASSGDYVATGSVPRVARVPDHVLGDTSVRAQVRVTGNINAVLGVRRQMPLVGYAGEIQRNGTLQIARVDGVASPVLLGSAVAPFNPVEQDVMLQFDAFDDKLSLWAWLVGDQMPDLPQLVVFDDMYAEGPAGLISAGFAGGPSDSTTFRFIHVADTHIPGLRGDFNSNGILDVGDINELTTQTSAMSNPSAFDLNSDALVNSSDINIWIQDLFHSWIGDANLDGQFNSSDLVEILAAGTYEADLTAVWSTGDFDGNGRFDTSDLVTALAVGGYEQGPRALVSAIPEPTSSGMLVVGLIGIAVRRRHMRSTTTR